MLLDMSDQVSGVERFVYVLTSSPTQFGSGGAGETAPESVEEVHADAWTAIDAARTRLGRDRVLLDELGDTGYDAGIVWSGRSGRRRLTVTRMEVVPPSGLPGTD